MKNPLHYLLIFAMVVLLSYCGDKEEGVTPEDDNTEKNDSTTNNDTTSNEAALTPEENKTLMQDIGVQFVNEISGMQDLSAVDAAAGLGQFVEFEDDDEFGGGRMANSFLTRFSKAVIGFSQGRITPIQFGHLPTVVAEDDPESLGDLFDEFTGTFEWNFSTEEFDYTDNSDDEVIIKYPSEDDGTSNNAMITLSNYSSVEIANPIDEEYSGDLPTSLDISMELDGTEVMTYGFEIDYNNEGIPESVDTEMTMESYALSVSLTNTDTKIGQSVNFKHDDLVIIGTSLEATGDFTESALEDAEDTEDPTEVFEEGNFTFTLLDLKLTGTLDVDGIWPVVSDVETYYEPEYDDSRPDLEGNAETLEDALNEYGSLKMTYVSTGDVAADVEFYTYIDSYSYEWDGVTYTDEYIELGARMVFADGSKVDVEDFLTTGFESLEDAINDLLGDIEDQWDADIDEIDLSDL